MASLSTVAVGAHDAAVAVVGVLVEAEVGHEHERVADLVAQVAQRHLHDAVGVPGAAALARPCAAGTPNRITAGTPRSASSRTSLRSDSRVCCTTPGSDAIGWGASMPSRTNSGATRSSTVRRVSATRRRSAGVRRRRRRRRAGKLTPPHATGLGRGLPKVGHERVDEAVDGVLGGLDVDAQARARARCPAVTGPMQATTGGTASGPTASR